MAVCLLTLLSATIECEQVVPLRVAVERTKLHPNTLRKYFDEGTIDGKRAANDDRLLWTGQVRAIGGAPHFRNADGVRVDRDINGARGILLRALGDSPPVNPVR